MHSQEREGEPLEASPKKGVPTYEFDCRISPAALVSHEEKVLWETKKLPYGTPLVAMCPLKVLFIEKRMLKFSG